MSVGTGATLSTQASADIICHHYALLAVECESTLTMQRTSHQYSSPRCNVHKCPLCYAQEDINKKLLLSVNESSKQIWDAGLKIDMQCMTEEHCCVYESGAIVCLCVSECDAGLFLLVVAAAL